MGAGETLAPVKKFRIGVTGRGIAMSAVGAEGMTLTGTAPASRIGQASWALYEWARNPYYILVIIYIFSPYFTNVVVGDPVRGQVVWGYIISVSGFLLAAS